MKYIFGAVVAFAVAFLALSGQPAAAANTNRFTISSYDINYVLSRDDSQRSTLRTTETITAQFPSYDQNHGIERAIPGSYDGHSIGLRVESIKDASGNTLEYSTYESNGNTVLRIGNANAYVHGEQTYVITYKQRDVTRAFSDTARDEWYWDTNGTEWRVPIQHLRVSATIDDALLESREGEAFCYSGSQGSNDLCELTTGNADATYSVEAKNLRAGENVTIAVGFKSGTFAQYKKSLLDILATIWTITVIVTGVAAFVIFICLTVSFLNRRNRTKEVHPIVAEYIPPRNVSVITSSQVIDASVSVFSAQLIDFAVRHYIEIVETKPKSTWSPAAYTIRIITDPGTLLAEEREILEDMFGHLPQVGEELALDSLRTNYAYIARTHDNDTKLKHLIEGEYAIREKSPALSKFFYRWSIGLVIVGVVTFSPFVLFFAGVIALYGVFIRPLTNKGVELRRYVLGLDRYIKAAEAERLAFLQGPDTAQKVGMVVNTGDSAQLVKLYERVLPYAILFGREKEWAKRLGDFYATTQTQPGWYSGTTPFNAAVFGATIGSFSQSAGYSGGSSSSSGGSSGGGSSGGGGGGGGGGGW